MLEKELAKRGRIREYRYMITERGRRRLAYYRRKETESISAINFEELIRNARNQVMPINGSAHVIFNRAENICNIAEQKKVFSMGKQCANMSAYFIMEKHDIISAYAAKKLLSLIAPGASLAIENALRKSSTDNFLDLFEMSSVVSRRGYLGDFRMREEESISFSDILWFLTMRRINELHAGQCFLYRMLEEERAKTEMYKNLWESARACHNRTFERSSVPYEETWRLHEVFLRGKSQGFEHGLKLGTMIGQLTTHLQVQGRLLTSLMKNHLSRRRKEQETFQARPNDWWKFLPPGFNSPRLPVRGPAGL